MSVPFFDLKRQYAELKVAIDGAVADVLQSQHFIGGVHVASLEEAMARRVGVPHAIGVSSGTDALLVSLMALDLKPGDEVITSPFTFFAPVEAILRCGARPVFVDIDPLTFNLDPGLVEKALTSRTRAILPVHLFGQSCDMSALIEIAEGANLIIIEDMAQAIDATHKGRDVGTFGQTGCLSFFPTKNLGCAGDGGMVFCRDDEVAARIRRLCRHGAEPKYHHVEVGGNFRLDALQAAILRVKLEHLDRWTALRREHAAFYDEALSDIDDVETPEVATGNSCVFNQYVIRSQRRDEVQRGLGEAGVGSNIYYPQGLHTQPALAHLGYEAGDFPQTERACREVLALPIFPELTPRERQEVVDVLGKI